MPKVRKDNKGRNLRTGETQRSDGSYMFVYKLGTKKSTFMIPIWLPFVQKRSKLRKMLMMVSVHRKQ